MPPVAGVAGVVAAAAVVVALVPAEVGAVASARAGVVVPPGRMRR
jgi:hypothetical protein